MAGLSKGQLKKLKAKQKATAATSTEEPAATTKDAETNGISTLGGDVEVKAEDGQESVRTDAAESSRPKRTARMTASELSGGNMYDDMVDEDEVGGLMHALQTSSEG
ncbi:hypothetical protein EMMF5_001715 [Cystobasidiomycetes sp. EMM_F5]